MELQPPPIATCRFCSHYDPQGRRGGECHKLGVPVRGYWRACPLAMAAFNSHDSHSVVTPRAGNYSTAAESSQTMISVPSER